MAHQRWIEYNFLQYWVIGGRIRGLLSSDWLFPPQLETFKIITARLFEEDFILVAGLSLCRVGVPVLATRMISSVEIRFDHFFRILYVMLLAFSCHCISYCKTIFKRLFDCVKVKQSVPVWSKAMVIM